MNKRVRETLGLVAILVLAVLVFAPPAGAVINGLTGTTFNLIADDGYISTPDGGSIYTWGYGESGKMMQYPGPTLIVNQGDTITVTLTNNLPASAGNVSMIFTGQDVAASGGAAGLLTREAPADGTTQVTYTFTAGNPGTFMYYSGTYTDMQVEMGLVGALIVRPATAGQAYASADSAYDHEILFLLTEMDPYIHIAVERSVLLGTGLADVDTTTFWPVYWFINGRCAPDTMVMDNVMWLPHQPYSTKPRLRPGEKLLMRMIGAGRDRHPFHHHGNNALNIARDGQLLSSGPGMGADLAFSDFTIPVVPGGTVDALYTWTGAGLGWDVYGHAPGDPLEPTEDPADHGKPFPVVLPGDAELTFGGQYSGSPFLGGGGSLPPGEGGMNAYGGFFFMWHSHNEKEMTSWDIFPGGMMTNVIVEPPGTPIP